MRGRECHKLHSLPQKLLRGGARRRRSWTHPNQRPPMTQGLQDPLQSPPWRNCKEKKGEGIKPDSKIVEYCVRGLGLGNGDFGWGQSERERKTSKWRKPCVNL